MIASKMMTVQSPKLVYINNVWMYAVAHLVEKEQCVRPNITMRSVSVHQAYKAIQLSAVLMLAVSVMRIAIRGRSVTMLLKGAFPSVLAMLVPVEPPAKLATTRNTVNAFLH